MSAKKNPTPAQKKSKEQLTKGQHNFVADPESLKAQLIPTPAQFLTSEGIIFYGTPVPFTEEKIHELLNKYRNL